MKSQTKTLVGSLPIVAKALSENYGVTLEIRGSQACASEDTIVLPVLPEDDHRAAILARGYLDHEAGHIKHTEMNMSKIGNSFGNSLLNTLEDIRIEQAMNRRYPGCRQNLHKLMELLVADGDFKPLQPTDLPASIIHDYLLHMLRARVLGQQALEPLAQQDAAIFDQTFPGIRARLDPIALEVATAPDTWTVKEITKRIIRLFQDLAAKQPQDGNNTGQQDQQSQGESNAERQTETETPDNADGEQSDSSPSQSGNDADQNESSDGQEPDHGKTGQPQDFQSEAQDDGDAGQSNSQLPNARSDPGGQEDAGDDPDRQDDPSLSKKRDDDNAKQHGGQEPPDSAVQAALEALADDTHHQDFGQVVANKLQQVVANKLQAIGKGHGNSPGIGIAKEVPPWWESGCHQLAENEIMAATARLRAMLGGVVQARRAVRNRPSLAGTRLNLRGLPRLAVKDGRVFLSRQERQAVNTAIYLLLDQSGSMKFPASTSRITVAYQATVALAKALRAIPGTAVAVGSFTTTDHDEPVVIPLLRFEQPDRCLSRSVPPAWENTPLAESIYFAAAQLLRRQEPRRMLVCITDGDPDCRQMAENSIGRCRASGIEVYGVGIMHDRIKKLFGDQHSVVIDRLSELPDKLFRLLAKQL